MITIQFQKAKFLVGDDSHIEHEPDAIHPTLGCTKSGPHRILDCGKVKRLVRHEPGVKLPESNGRIIKLG